MIIEHIDTTSRYKFERRKQDSTEDPVFNLSRELQTAYLHSGNAMLEVNGKNGLERINVSAGEGIVLTPGIEHRLSTEDRFDMFWVSSDVNDGLIIEINDEEGENNEVPIEGYKIIKNPKRVNKPWGHELWIIWTKDYHVLKQIGMTAGNRSSLQFHREKLETNYLVEGEADVIDGCKLEPYVPVEELKAFGKRIDFGQYKKRMIPGMHWTSEPGTIHRVISEKTYLAYEVSTPELDDVVRLQDDSGRESGRIISEHRSI